MDRIEDMLDPNEGCPWGLFGIEDPKERQAITLFNEGYPRVECFRQVGWGEPVATVRDRASRFFRSKRIQRASKGHKIWIERATETDLSDRDVSKLIDTAIKTQGGQTQLKAIELRDKRQERLSALKEAEDSSPVVLFRRLVSRHPNLSDAWFTELARGMALSPERLTCRVECDLRDDGDMRGCVCRRYSADITDDDNDAYRAALAELRPSPNGYGKSRGAPRSPGNGGGVFVVTPAVRSVGGANGTTPANGSETATQDRRALPDDALETAEN